MSRFAATTFSCDSKFLRFSFSRVSGESMLRGGSCEVRRLPAPEAFCTMKIGADPSVLRGLRLRKLFFESGFSFELAL